MLSYLHSFLSVPLSAVLFLVFPSPLSYLQHRGKTRHQRHSTLPRGKEHQNHVVPAAEEYQKQVPSLIPKPESLKTGVKDMWAAVSGVVTRAFKTT